MEALYDQYAPNLYGIIARIVPDRVAEEALQKTFLKVWNNIGSFDPSVASLYTWMSTIARNTAVDYRRLKSFQRSEKTVDLDNVVYRESATTVSGAHIDVQALLANLDEKLRVVLEYAYLKGYTHKEIAEALDMPMGTVKTRLRNAILALRSQLKHEKDLFRGGIGMLLTMIMSGI